MISLIFYYKLLRSNIDDRSCGNAACHQGKWDPGGNYLLDWMTDWPIILIILIGLLVGWACYLLCVSTEIWAILFPYKMPLQPPAALSAARRPDATEQQADNLTRIPSCNLLQIAAISHFLGQHTNLSLYKLYTDVTILTNQHQANSTLAWQH